MGKYRKRFNEKARAGMLAKQAALKSARQKQFTRHLQNEEPEAAEPIAPAAEDPNAAILKPMSATEKEERKRTLAESLYSENERESKMSRAKKKRLDKYIEHQIKREEKKVLMEKLAGTKFDTSILSSSKLLGTGKQTRREEMIEALHLEQQGRADDRTRAILYEEREVKEWDSGSESDKDAAGAGTALEDAPATEAKSSFIDYRPSTAGGAGVGFGFSGLPKVEKSAPKKKYTWRLKMEQEELKKRKKEDEDDFVSSDEPLSGTETPESDPDTSDNGSDDEDGEVAAAAATAAESGSESEAEAESDSEPEAESEDEPEAESESESEPESDEGERLSKPKHSRTAASFKEWAEQQVRSLEGRQEMVLPTLTEDTKKQYAGGLHEAQESEDEDAVPINTALQREAFYVSVTRPIEIQESRMQLPVFAEEHRIMEAVHHHDCIVLCGETGSGKTTQVPQFLYEAGFGNLQSKAHAGMIGVTQPRRVAAVSMAKRIAAELGEVHGKRVGYQIRFDATVKNEGQEGGTALKLMTDGVLLREMMNDLLLRKYSAIVIDEAHERNVNTDILIGMLSRVVALRRAKKAPLKLIIMSATLRVTDFSENTQLFPVPPPVIQVDARQYPVAVHFDKKTRFDYLEQAFKKTCKIHRRLPPGGILVFLTGQHEINALVKRLRREFPVANKRLYAADTGAVQYRASKNVAVEAEDVDLDIALRVRKDAAAAADAESSGDDASDDEGFEESVEQAAAPLYVLPLYSLLPTSQQMQVFDPPPPGSRLCIVATNVAETSLTIPGIRYVVDCGRAKERQFDEDTGVQSFEVDWVSKASAGQRAGRAGRTGPGHCYRLYSSALYEEHFAQFSRPEILRMPVEATVLTMKSMGIDHIVNFPFPTPPARAALAKAETLLVTLGALDKAHKHITPLGRTMAHFPLSPRFAKILIVGNQLDCLPYVIAIVSALSVGDPFLDEHELGLARDRAADDDAGSADDATPADVERQRALRGKFHRSRAVFARLDAHSDAFKWLAAVCALDHVSPERRARFVGDNFLRGKTMEEIAKLRQQISSIVVQNVSEDSIAGAVHAQRKLGVPTPQQVSAMKQIIASGFIDQVAVRADVVDPDQKLSKKASITSVPYSTITPVTHHGSDVDPYVYVHPGSIIAASGATPPEYVVYQSVTRGANQNAQSLVRLRMRPLVDLSGRLLANVAKSSLLLSYSKPLGHPYAPKNITPSKRECYVVPRYGAQLGDGGLGWDLPVVKITQVKKHGSWVEE